LKKLIFSALIASFVVFLDYLTKKLVVIHVNKFGAISLLPFLRIVYVENEGAAFGLFSNIGNNTFIFISIAAIILIGLYIISVTRWLELFSLSLILGGATGNLIDRLMIGKVIDFIDFFVGKWHWPAFNVADSALTVGLILFLLSNLRYWRHKG